MVRVSGAATRSQSDARPPGAFGVVLAVAGLALGVWLALRNGADTPSLLLSGAVGLAVGAGLAFLADTLLIVCFVVAFVGGLFLHVAYAGSVAPVWPFALFLGLTLAREGRSRRLDRSSTS